ncbi:hypothetical protein [Brucella rhizosphaerae]|uniref:hypothetical protein n=1 Tax=Brucella rhizosphaerae TaxID=571254 RepID=UPI0004AE4BCF|nr:hypothetical protein [Brucella rhizosphaerae]
MAAGLLRSFSAAWDFHPSQVGKGGLKSDKPLRTCGFSSKNTADKKPKSFDETKAKFCDIEFNWFAALPESWQSAMTV